MSVTPFIWGLSKCHCSVRTLLSPAAVFCELLALLLPFLGGAVPGGSAIPAGSARTDPHCSTEQPRGNGKCRL